MASDSDADQEFSKRITAIDESMEHARTYLDRHELKPDPQWLLPRLAWLDTGHVPVRIAAPTEPRCRAKAIHERGMAVPYGIPVVVRSSMYCNRPPGHSGMHAIRVRRHAFKRSLWEAYGWVDQLASG